MPTTSRGSTPEVRVFLDTDIILDLLLQREPYFDAAARLFLLLQQERIEGCVSPLIFSNLFYILRKERSGPEAFSILRRLRLLTRVLRVDEETLDAALSSSFSDFEDAIQYYAALEYDVHAIVTRNKRDFRLAKLPVLSAEECLALYGLDE
jgi:predicted nucleic acid-binding protein